MATRDRLADRFVIEIPAAVLANWESWFPGEAAALRDDILARCAAAQRAWNLDDPVPLPGGEVGLVLAVRVPGGDTAVLKLGPGTGSSAEGEALQLWAASGLSPQVLGVRDAGATLLLERVRPGDSLRDTGAGAAEIVDRIGGLCPSLHLGGDLGRFASLAEHAVAEGWTGAVAGTREEAELTRLSAASDADRLLHLDLHWLNVLRGVDRWLVIDPKAVVGDPHAEVFAFFDGPPLFAVPRAATAARPWVAALTERYARAAGLDGDRVRAWVRLRGLAMLGSDGNGGGHRGESIRRLVDALG